MGTEKVTRRVLLTVGGFTLLGSCAGDPARHVTAVARTPQARPSLTESTDARPARRPRSPHPDPTEHPQLTAAHPAGRGPGGAPLDQIDDGPRAIALTIDDGPSPVYTPQVLALLARYRITATFSMIGLEVQSHPAVAREVAAAGHLIANHTWSHLDLQRLSPALVTEQMTRGADAIHAATGRVPALFRAPYGAWSPFVLAQCARAGLTPLGWSVDPRDWSRPGVPSIVANIMRNTRGGSIILEHDGGGNRAQTVAALEIVIPGLLAAGYHFRTP